MLRGLVLRERPVVHERLDSLTGRRGPDRFREEKGGIHRLVHDLAGGGADAVGDDAVFVWCHPGRHRRVRGEGETGEAGTHFVRRGSVGGELFEEGCFGLFEIISAEPRDIDPDDHGRSVAGTGGGGFGGHVLLLRAVVFLHRDFGRGHLRATIFLEDGNRGLVSLEGGARELDALAAIPEEEHDERNQQDRDEGDEGTGEGPEHGAYLSDLESPCKSRPARAGGFLSGGSAAGFQRIPCFRKTSDTGTPAASSSRTVFSPETFSLAAAMTWAAMSWGMMTTPSQSPST